jgi:hypothetical protein
MAQFTKVHGDFQPLMNYDSANYSVGALNAITSAVTVQPQGPKLDFFTITGNGTQVLDNIATVFQTVQQLATIHIYEYTNTTDDTLAIAIYPTGAWTTVTLDNELTNAWSSANVSVASSATFTSP